MTATALHDGDLRPDRPHVYSVEWNAWERVFRVDGQEHHRERHGVVVPRQRIVRSAVTCDYEVVEVFEVADVMAGYT